MQTLLTSPRPGQYDGLRATLRYLMQTEVHVYAFAIAASVLLSFFPFLNVILSICRYVLRWPAAINAIYLALSDFFPEQVGYFIRYNVTVIVGDRGLRLGSLALLLFVANGVFEPLEVALNRAWGVTRNRPYWRNQLISLGLILICGTLAMLSMMFAALNYALAPHVLGPQSPLTEILALLFFKVAAIPLSMLALFLVYWLLPNRKIPPRQVIPAAIVVGLVLEAVKYLNLLAWPIMRTKLWNEYGPFYYSASIVISSFFAAMVVLAGAEWSARGGVRAENPPVARPPGIG